MIAALLILAAAPRLAPALALRASGAQGPLQRFDPAQDVGIDQRLGALVPGDVQLTDEAGRPVAFGDLFDGRPVILALVYYECPMLCSLVLDGALRALRPLELDAGAEFTFVAVSIDPREGPELACATRARLAEEYGRSPDLCGWRALTGSEAEIARLAEAVGFRYAYDEPSGEYAHAGGLMVLTPARELSRYFYGVDYQPRDVRLALVEAAGGRIGSLADQVLMLCMQWDPRDGKYSFAVVRALQLAGIATVLAIGAFVGRSLWREARARAGRPRTAPTPTGRVPSGRAKGGG
jgi:protein SCO1/2